MLLQECGTEVREWRFAFVAPVAFIGAARGEQRAIVGGQRRIGAQFVAQRRTRANDKRGERFLAFAERKGDAALDPVDATQRSVDLAQFDAITADLDLLVAAAEELQRAVGPVAAEVAGAVPTLAAGDDELPRGAVEVIEIAAVHAGR